MIDQALNTKKLEDEVKKNSMVQCKNFEYSFLKNHSMNYIQIKIYIFQKVIFIIFIAF